MELVIQYDAIMVKKLIDSIPHVDIPKALAALIDNFSLQSNKFTIIKGRRDAITNMLLDRMSPNYRYEDDDTPLHLCVMNYDYDTVVHLISVGADPTLRNKFNQTPVHLCESHMLFESGEKLKITQRIYEYITQLYTSPCCQDSPMTNSQGQSQTQASSNDNSTLLTATTPQVNEILLDKNISSSPATEHYDT